MLIPAAPGAPSEPRACGVQGYAFIRQDKSWDILAYIKLVWEYLQTHGNKRQCLLTTHFSVILCKNTLIAEWKWPHRDWLKTNSLPAFRNWKSHFKVEGIYKKPMFLFSLLFPECTSPRASTPHPSRGIWGQLPHFKPSSQSQARPTAPRGARWLLSRQALKVKGFWGVFKILAWNLERGWSWGITAPIDRSCQNHLLPTNNPYSYRVAYTGLCRKRVTPQVIS